MDFEHCLMPTQTSHSTFFVCLHELIESDLMCSPAVTTLDNLAYITASVSIVQMDIDGLQVALCFRMVVKPNSDWYFATMPFVYTVKFCGLLFENISQPFSYFLESFCYQCFILIRAVSLYAMQMLDRGRVRPCDVCYIEIYTPVQAYCLFFSDRWQTFALRSVRERKRERERESV